MDAIYPLFARGNAVFYDDPDRRPVASAEPYRPAADLDWGAWGRHDDGHWVFWQPPRTVLPEQGWKIHVSAIATVAGAVLDRVSRHCHGRGLAFKHLPHEAGLFATNAKDAERAGAGKFITIYPRDAHELRRTLDALDEAIGGQPGPYVLSDLRWRRGPLFVRYGAYVHRSVVDDDGVESLALRHPDGHLVPDPRTPGFTPPEWIELPGFLREQLDALGDDAPPAGFPRITGALHHSNAGGVYEAEDAGTGARIVVKEARPHAGLTPDGRDAVDRLRHEETTLRALSGLPVARVHGAVTLHGHRFLLLEHVDGTSVQSSVAPRIPTIRADSTASDYLDYRQWALEVCAKTDAAISLIHAAGHTHGDVHPGNVILRDDGRVTLLDFEMSRPVGDDASVRIGAPGFVAPDGRGGRAADRYGLACVKVFLFYPLTPLFMLDPHKPDDLLSAAAEVFALDEAFTADVRRDLALTVPVAADPDRAERIDRAVRDWDVSGTAAIRALQADVAAELNASADVTRRDRLWPGDPRQFAEDGVGLAHGAAGVIHALHASGVAPDERSLAWIDRALHGQASPKRPHRPGLWDGLAGVVWLHRSLGKREKAEEGLETLRGADFLRLSSDLHSGLPGIGLVLLDALDQDPSLLVESLEIAQILHDRHDARPAVEPGAPVQTGSGGLLRGATGTALFALRLFEQTGDADHLRLAERALAHDVAHCIAGPDGSLQVNEGWRLLPYLGAGSAGIGVVAAQLLPHAASPDRCYEWLEGVQAAALADFTIEPGLFQGRAGLIVFLATLRSLGLATPRTDEALRRHLSQLRLHALRRPDGIAFPGQGLLRVSCDLATGSAGVLLALEAGAREGSATAATPLVPLLLPTAEGASPQDPAHARSLERR